MIRETSEIGVAAQPQVFVSYARQDAEQVLDDRAAAGGRTGHRLARRGPHPRRAVLRRADRARDRPLEGRHADVLAARVPVGQRAPRGAADLGPLPPPLSPGLALPGDGHPGAIPLLPGGLPVDRRALAADGAMAAATAQGAPGPGGRDDEAGRSAAGRSDAAIGRRACETERRSLRFKPGDRPIQGADWEVERLLGKGGFGEVWKAHNPAPCQACRRWP